MPDTTSSTPAVFTPSGSSITPATPAADKVAAPPAKTDKEIAVEKADKDVQDKQDALTKANEAAVAAHSALMASQLERSKLGA